MSYLGYPRLNFAGRFQSDISTVNNALKYYDNNSFEPRFQRYAYFTDNTVVDENGLFNPKGTGAFRIVDTRVTTGFHPDGRVASNDSDDPVIGGEVAEDDLRANAKMVDIDQRDQTVPGLYGLLVRVLDMRGTELLRGDFVPSWSEDLWRRGPGDQLPGGTNASASYQSVLTNLRWAERIDSPLLRALRDTTAEDMLSIRLVLDGYEIDIKDYNPQHTFGRLIGSIGPYHPGEPKRFVAARRLRKLGENPKMWDTPLRVDREARKVFIDVCNSWPTTGKAGPIEDLGAVRLAALDGSGGREIIGPLDRMDKGFLEREAGIATVDLDPGQLESISEQRLVLIDSAEKPVTLLSENEDASWSHADESVFRLYPQAPEDRATAVVYATRFGNPAPDVDIALKLSPPTPAIQVPQRVRTDADGRAEVALSGTHPDTTAHIDGVVSTIHIGPANRSNEPDAKIVALVFNKYDVPARPTWNRDVRPIFQQYANLYPVMGGLFDLGNYNHVVEQKAYIRRTMLASRESPNHMPVSRDLSTGKRDMIVKWLETAPTPPVLEIESVDELRDVLQQALLVEQATIPPYSAALFSIKPGRNVKIRELIRGVLLEEMQHMVQVANILNAIGGKPQVGRPALVPTYPGKLPGPVLPDLQVRLRKLSREHVKDVFMAIERPELPTVDGETFKGAVIDPKQVDVDRAGDVKSMDEQSMATLEEWFDKAEYAPQTIGWFYNQIAKAILRLDRGGSLFTGDPARQVSWPDAPGILYRVTDRRSALLGIYQIIEQGEGSPHDLDDDKLGDPEELGHYYRFEEIVKGRQLIKKDDGTWAYEGPEIPFDPEGVHPVVDDADSYKLPKDSVARRESLRCDSSYTNMLTSLNRVFNGHPGELDDSVGLMGQLQVQAKRLYEIQSGDGAGTVVGPAFQSPKEE